MARYNANRYQYETSPRKIQPDYKPKKKTYPKKSTAVKTNKKNKNKVNIKSNNKKRVVLTVGLVFAALFAISYRNRNDSAKV